MANKLETAIDWVASGFPAWSAARNLARARASYYEQAQRSMSRGSSMSYRGAVTTRLNESVPSGYGQTGIRSLTGSKYRKMAARAQHLVENNGLASSLLGSSVDLVIGSGTRIEPETKDKDFNARAGDTWREWWNGENGGSPEVRGMFSGPKLERLKYRQRLRDGDGGVILLGNGKIQSIRGDIIESPYGSSSQTGVIDGLKLDNKGMVLGYWLRTIDPSNPTRRAWKFIKARDFVRSARIKDEDQIRGETCFAQQFELFEQLDGYIDGVIVASRMAAMFGLIIEEAPAQFNAYTNGLTKDGNGTDRPAFDMEAGMVKRINAGEKVQQVKPEQPASNFDQLVTSLVRFAGIELNLPLEMALLDFSKTTYSSAKAAFEVAKRSATADHQEWSREFISPIYRWKISQWIRDGVLDPPKGDDKPWRHRAVQQPYPYLDPQKDAQGELLLRDGGLKSHEQCLAERDTTVEKLAASNARTNKTLAKHGVTVGRSRLVDMTATNTPKEPMPEAGKAKGAEDKTQ